MGSFCSTIELHPHCLHSTRVWRCLTISSAPRFRLRHAVGANLFASVPRGYDLYTIKHVLHDWDDDNAGLILRRIAEALEGDARLVIVEGMLDRSFDGGRDESSYLHVRNIEQRVWTPGRARTRADFDALCAQAGLRIEQVRHLAISDISYLRCVRACAAG